MKLAPRYVLDASALLAAVNREEGGRRVFTAILDRAAISAVNLAEALYKVAAAGRDPGHVEADFRRKAGLTADDLRVLPYDRETANLAARLKALVYPHLKLSLADFALLATGRLTGATVLTGDSEVTWIDLGIPTEHFRPRDLVPRPAGVPAKLAP